MESFAIETFQQLGSGVESFATVVAIIIGAWWAYQRFIRQQEDYPHIAFSADVNFICQQNGYWIVELISVLQNSGKVPHRFSVFEFDLHALFSEDQIEVSDEFGGQAFFPHEIVRGTWKPDKFTYFTISPGESSKYSFIARVPENSTAVILHSWFEYEGKRRKDLPAGHTAERTVRVPEGSDRNSTD